MSASAISTRQEWLRTLSAIWIAITAALIYLDVPISNALKFSLALLLQASIGAAVVTKMLRRTSASILLLLGPGLILGGTLTFTIFQIAGRGFVGMVVTYLVGVAALIVLVRDVRCESQREPNWWMLGQIMGTAGLVIAPEFTEVLPAVVVFFVLGYVAAPGGKRKRSIKVASTVVGILSVSVLWPLRQPYWWTVSDDYNLFEVIARHVTVEGPFADWGSSNFSRYHWLSYGWSGLLDLLGGGPAPLTTLTKVMPISYALSLSASLALIVKQVHQTSLTFPKVVLVWAIVSIGQWDWAGTSTAGVYAVLAAFIATALCSLSDSDRVNFGSAIFVMLFLPIIALTKLPSVFSFAVALLTAVLLLARQNIAHLGLRRLVFYIGWSCMIPLILAGVALLGRIAGTTEGTALFKFTRLNPDLGQLSLFGAPFVTTILVLNHIWLWIIVSSAITRSSWRNDLSWGSRWLALTSPICLLLGLLFGVFLDGSSNSYTYFTGPMYFLSSLGLAVVEKHKAQDVRVWVKGKSLLMATAMVTAGLLWSYAPISEMIWDFTAYLSGTNSSLRIEILRFFTSDRRFGVSLLALVLFVSFGLTRPIRRIRAPIFHSLLASLVVVALVNLGTHYLTDIQRELGYSEIEETIGPRSVRKVGDWLRENTRGSELMATNYQLSEDSFGYEGYPLATWSQREFLVLGFPTPESRKAGQLWTLASKAVSSFATDANRESCNQLKQLKVRWFIVDLDNTRNQNWSACSTVAFSSQNFMVLDLWSDRNLD